MDYLRMVADSFDESIAALVFQGGISEVSALKVWQDCCHYLYLPRLVKDEVFKNAIHLGVSSPDFLGFAWGKQDVKISIEIQAASHREGFDEALQRSVKENCRVLTFGPVEFEGR